MLARKCLPAIGLVAALAALPQPAEAKDKVKVGFIGPLTGGTAANGIGGRNSAELAVKLRNADRKAKYEYELVVLDDECKPNVAVQVATKAGADRGDHRRGHALLLGRGDRRGRDLPQVRPADGGLGRGAARHHLPQQVSGGAPRQRHHDQPERGRGRS